MRMPEIAMRRATIADIPALVRLLVDDPLGAEREDADDLQPYLEAFARIEASPNTHLMVAEHHGRVVGTLTLTVLPGLSRRGATRANVEAVRVAGAMRGQGIGTEMMQWAIDTARALGCRRLQLTSDVSRRQAHRFYKRLGFDDSHLGFMKLL